MTREEWLKKLSTKLLPIFKAVGATVQPHRISMGFPGGGNRKTRVGECWSSKVSGDNHREIFISPIQDDSLIIAGTLTHELCHASLPDDAKHGKLFKELMTKIGLEGKARQAHPGPVLNERLKGLLSDLGNIPHSKIKLLERPGSGPKVTSILCLDCEGKFTVSVKNVEFVKVCPYCQQPVAP